MSLEVLMEKLASEALAKRVSRRGLPGALYGSAYIGNSLLELELRDLKVIDFKVEFNEVILPKFIVNQARLGRVVPNGSFRDVASLEKYWLIYRFTQDAYDVRWYALWLTHAYESSFSTNKRAFVRGALFGAMQRSVNLYPDSQVEEATHGYEFLAGLPQNHPSDWKEIMWAAWKLDQDAKVTFNVDRKDRNWAVGDAIQRYSPDGEVRRQEFEALRRIFG